MNNMTRDGVTYLGPEYNDFLYAPIGTERNGMLLTVLSALARKNVDPWQEADQLAGLPEKTAVQRLLSLIAVTQEPFVHSDVEAMATRLIALLPRRSGIAIPAVKKLSGARAINEFGIILYAVFMILAVTAQWAASSQQTAASTDSAHIVDFQHDAPNPSQVAK